MAPRSKTEVFSVYVSVFGKGLRLQHVTTGGAAVIGKLSIVKERTQICPFSTEDNVILCGFFSIQKILHTWNYLER